MQPTSTLGIELTIAYFSPHFRIKPSMGGPPEGGPPMPFFSFWPMMLR